MSENGYKVISAILRPGEGPTYIPIATDNTAPLGALQPEDVRQILSKQGHYDAGEIDHIMFRDHPNTDGHIGVASITRTNAYKVHRILNGGKKQTLSSTEIETTRVLVNIMSEPIIGPITVQDLADLYRFDAMVLQEKKKWLEREDAIIVKKLAQQKLLAPDGQPGVPLLINDPYIFSTLWPGGPLAKLGGRYPETPISTHEPTIAYLSSHQLHLWAHNGLSIADNVHNGPLNEPRSPLTKVQQVILHVAAYKIMNEVVANAPNRSQTFSDLARTTYEHRLVELAPTSFYFTRLLGSGDHLEAVVAVDELVAYLKERAKFRGNDGARVYGLSGAMHMLSTIGLLANDWRHLVDPWNEFVTGVKLPGYDHFAQFFPPIETKQAATNA